MADIPSPPSGPAGSKGQVLDAKMWAIYSICGLIALYWIWIRVGEINTYLGREVIKPLFVIISIICFPVAFYVLWLMVNAIHEMQEKAGLSPKDEKVMDLISFLCAPYGVYRAQGKLNAVWQK